MLSRSMVALARSRLDPPKLILLTPELDIWL